MADLVERLRRRAQGKQMGDDPLAKVLGEAADEIERLRERVGATERDLARALAALDHHLKLEPQAAADEIERLRELLQGRTDAYKTIMAALSRRAFGEEKDE